MFIAQERKGFLATEERKACSEANCLAPPELEISLYAWLYEHLVPPGLRNRAETLVRFLQH